MTGLFGFLFFVGLITTPVSGIVWIVKKLRHKTTKAKIVCLAAALVTVVSFAGIGITYEPTEKVEEPPTAGSTEPAQSDAQQPTEPPADIMPPVTTLEPEDTPQGTTEPPEASTPEASTPEASTPEPATPPAETESVPPPEEPEQSPASVTINLPVQERPVMNGMNTERIGTWARIITTKEYLETVPDRSFYEWLEELAENDYNWINVTFGDGTGLYCYMDGYLIEYGCVDETEGGAVESGDSVDVRYFHFDGETGTYLEDEK